MSKKKRLFGVLVAQCFMFNAYFGADRFGSGARKAAPEDSQPREDAPLDWREQRPGMLEGRPQAALSRRHVARWRRQEIQVRGDFSCDLRAGQQPHPGCRKLDS